MGGRRCRYATRFLLARMPWRRRVGRSHTHTFFSVPRAQHSTFRQCNTSRPLYHSMRNARAKGDVGVVISIGMLRLAGSTSMAQKAGWQTRLELSQHSNKQSSGRASMDARD